MPPVISLLSSSPEPHALKSKGKTAINKPQARSFVATKAASVEKNAPKNDIFTISDDEESLPSKQHAKITNRVDSKTESRFSLPPLSSDDDPYTLPSPKSFESARPTMVAKTAKRDRDFFYNSDDFDSMVNLDASLKDIREPAAKKTRSSSISSSNTPFPKASAFQDTSTVDKIPMKPAAYKRSYSDIELTKQAADVPKTKRSNTTGSSRALEIDPLIFTSSPDPYMDAGRKRAEKRKGTTSTGRGFSLDPLPELSSDIDLPDYKPIPTSSKVRPKKCFSTLAQYEADREKEKKATAKKIGKSKKDGDNDDEKRKRALVKEAENEKRLQAKEDKLREKEAKARDKEKAAAIAKVNTLRTDKKVSAPEMIVDMSSALETKLTLMTEVFLDKYKIEHSKWESLMPVVKFRRKINAIFNEEVGQYEPVPRHVKDEKHVIYIMHAPELVELVTNQVEGDELDLFVLKLQGKFEGCKIIILIEGYNMFIRKNKNLKNRHFTQAVRGEEPPAASQRKKKKEAEYIDENLLEDALLCMQMNHGLLIHHTAVHSDTAEQLVVFTQQISLIPYKTQKQPNGTTFCMDSGQVKTGDNPTDTYAKMLQEMVRVTTGVALGIVDKYPSVRELVDGLQENGSMDLEDCKKSSNRNGGFTDSRVGPAISKRVFKVFTLRDPNSFDV